MQFTFWHFGETAELIYTDQEDNSVQIKLRYLVYEVGIVVIIIYCHFFVILIMFSIVFV